MTTTLVRRDKRVLTWGTEESHLHGATTWICWGIRRRKDLQIKMNTIWAKAVT